jgi:hypothetical protein
MPLEIFPSSPGTFGGTTSPVATEQTTTSKATFSTVLTPPGLYMIINGGHNTARYSPDSGVTRRTVIAASSGGLIWSDGQNMDIYNDATGGSTSNYALILGVS